MRIFWAVLRHVFKNSAGNTIADVFPEDIEVRDFSVKGYKKTTTLHLWLESLTGYHSSKYFPFSTFSQPIIMDFFLTYWVSRLGDTSNGRVHWRTSTSWSRIWRKSSSIWCWQPIRCSLVMDDEVWVPSMCFVYFIITLYLTSLLYRFPFSHLLFVSSRGVPCQVLIVSRCYFV